MPTPRQTTIWLTVLGLGVVGIFAVTVFRGRPSTEAPDRPVVRPTDYTRGPVSAKVTIIEFGDYQCAFCRQNAEAVNQALAKYGDDVRHVWKDYPFSDHPEARPAAIAARCAGEQGKFWAYHDALLAKQGQLGEALYRSLASDLGIDLGRFVECRSASATAALVDAAVDEAHALSIATLPTTFINAARLSEAISAQNLMDLIAAELANPSPR